MINNSLELLVEPFRTKAKVFMEVCRRPYPNLAPFETLRSVARQRSLIFKQKNNPKSWITRIINPNKSYHVQGKAVDRVFMYKGQPKRAGDYAFLHRIAKMCGMEGIPGESCHIQDDGLPIRNVMACNSERYKHTTSAPEQHYLHCVNEAFRLHGYT